MAGTLKHSRHWTTLAGVLWLLAGTPAVSQYYELVAQPIVAPSFPYQNIVPAPAVALDQKGYPGIILNHLQLGVFSVFLNPALTGFNSANVYDPQPGSIGGAEGSLIAAQVTGDAFPDYLWGGAAFFTLLINDGTGGFGTPIPMPMPN